MEGVAIFLSEIAVRLLPGFVKCYEGPHPYEV